MPANVQPNGSAELTSPAIVLVGDQAFRTLGYPAVDGSYVIRLAALKPLIGGDEIGQATWPDATVVSGETYDVSLWVRHEFPATNPEPLLVEIDTGGGTFATALSITQDDDGIYYKQTFSFAASGTTARIRISAQYSSELLQSHFYTIDAIRMEKRDAAMAIKLAERGVAAVVSLLQSDLGTELAAIDTERADGMSMAVPAAGDYHTYPKIEIAGSTVHVEVFELEFASLNFYTDADAARAVYELPLTIRITHFNRSNYSATEMATRDRRYAAGVFNTFLQTPLIDAADAAIQIGDIESHAPIWETDGEDATKVIKSRVTLGARLRCEESYS